VSELLELPTFKLRRMREILEEINIEKAELGYRRHESDTYMKVTKDALASNLNPEIIREIVNKKPNWSCGFPGCNFKNKMQKKDIMHHIKIFHNPIIFVYFNLMVAPLPILSSNLCIFSDKDLQYVFPIHVDEIDFQYISSYVMKQVSIHPLWLIAIASGRTHFINWLRCKFDKCKDIELKKEIINNKDMWLSKNNCSQYNNWLSFIHLRNGNEYLIGMRQKIIDAMEKEFPLELENDNTEPRQLSQPEQKLLESLKKAKAIIKIYSKK
jgi:hypothetical protein